MVMDQVTVFFEGLGLPRMTWNKLAFTLFDRVICSWASLVGFLGVLAGLVFALRRGKKREGIAPADLFEVVLFGLFGARVLYMLRDFGILGSFFTDDVLLVASILLSVLLSLLVCSLLRVRPQKAADAIAPAILLGLCIGVFGALLAGDPDSAWMRNTTALELFGKTVTFPSGEGTVWYILRMGLYPNNEFTEYMIFVHPLFLYASVWCLLGFLVLLPVARHKAFDGQVFLVGLIWFSAGTILLSGLSTAALASTVQWLAAILVFLGTARLILLGVAYHRARKRLEAGLLVIVRGDSAGK